MVLGRLSKYYLRLKSSAAVLTGISLCLKTLVMLILIPLPLFFAQTVYGVRGLTAWVVIGMIWAFCSAICVVIYPLYESRAALGMITRGITKVRIVVSWSRVQGNTRLTTLTGYFYEG